MRRVEFYAWDSVGLIERLIHKWEPTGCYTESEAEASLAEFLQEELPGFRVRRQYPHDRIRADIVIDDRLAIELKLNLTSNRELHRLIGQIADYARWGVALVLVLVGANDPDLVGRLRREARRFYEVDQHRILEIG